MQNGGGTVRLTIVSASSYKANNIDVNPYIALFSAISVLISPERIGQSLLLSGTISGTTKESVPHAKTNCVRS